MSPTGRLPVWATEAYWGRATCGRRDPAGRRGGDAASTDAHVLGTVERHITAKSISAAAAAGRLRQRLFTVLETLLHFFQRIGALIFVLDVRRDFEFVLLQQLKNGLYGSVPLPERHVRAVVLLPVFEV